MSASIFGRYVAKGTDNDWKRMWISPRRRHPDGLDYQAWFGTHYIKGNSAPYFSVTGEGRDPAKRGRGEAEVAGCVHDAIHVCFPELREAIRWHLCGPLPMHMCANAAYWAEKVLGVSEWPAKSYDPNPLQCLSSALLIGELDGDHTVLPRILAPLPKPEPPAGIVFEQYADSPEGLKAQRFEVARRINLECAARESDLQRAYCDMLRRYRIPMCSIPRSTLAPRDDERAEGFRPFPDDDS